MNDKTLNVFFSFVLAYFLGFLITYGHAYNSRPDMNRVAGTEIYYKVSEASKAFDSLFISAFWPLYVSTIAWEK